MLTVPRVAPLVPPPGKYPADGEFSIALGETTLQPRIPIRLGQPSTTAATLLTAVQSVSAPDTVTVHAYAHGRTTGYSTLTLLVRRKVVLGVSPRTRLHALES